MKYVGELSSTCSQIVLKCLYLARIGRPDILWSVNKLARSITKWTKDCDKRLCPLISYIHHTRTGRPVKNGQPPGLFTQCEDIDIDFRVYGLPHAVVKQAENSRVRELVKKIENHPHRQALQVDL